MIVYLIILITLVVSIVAFNDSDLFSKLRFNAFEIKYNKQSWRFFTYGFIHVDWMHLLINMFVLYSFGEVVFTYFKIFFALKATIYFLLLYVGGILFATIADYKKHNENIYYNAVGASGAVSAVVFSSIILHPAGSIYFYFIPFAIPSVVFGILYLIYSATMTKKSNDNIGHSAHFWGALFGIVFTIALKPLLINRFIDEVLQLF